MDILNVIQKLSCWHSTNNGAIYSALDLEPFSASAQYKLLTELNWTEHVCVFV